MYLKQMSPLDILVKNHLLSIGHYNGVQLRTFNDALIDYIIGLIIDFIEMNRPLHTSQYSLSFDRGLHNEYKQPWLIKLLKERKRCQQEEHLEMVGKEKEQSKLLETENYTKITMTEYSENLPKYRKLINLQKVITIETQRWMELEKTMSSEEYTTLCLKKR